MNRPTANGRLHELLSMGRKAARAKNWPTVKSCAREILKQDRRSADGWFLNGLVAKAGRQYQQAVTAFSKVLHYDEGRYDAAIELADLLQPVFRHNEAAALVRKYHPLLENSPYYLLMAADTCTKLGLHDLAWPLYRRANELQPDVDRIQAGLAASSVLAGKIDIARKLYTGLLRKHPGHQRNHYELSRLGRAENFDHVNQMKAILDGNGLPPEKNIFLYYAIGKELEDLELWEEAFDYYRLGGNAASKQSKTAGYSVDSDIKLIDSIVNTCCRDWLESGNPPGRPEKRERRPIFIVGLPRTGTTLTERIVSSHSQVESVDETFFLRIAIKLVSGVAGAATMSSRIVEHAARKNSDLIAAKYFDAIRYRLGDSPFFIDKYPENYLYLGFIARAFPEARIVHLRRNPMDSCFAMYKQSYFRQAYTLDDLGNYYLAYDRLSRHWLDVLGDRLIDIEYEHLVAKPEEQVRALLGRLGLGFEPACMDFHLNESPSATASAAQVREKVHTRSVNKWKNWEKQLEPLRQKLEAAGIAVD